MKKVFSLLLLLSLVFFVAGCENVGLSDSEGFGKLRVSTARIDDSDNGEVYEENIDKVIVKGGFTGDNWETWIDLSKDEDGIWRISFSNVETEYGVNPADFVGEEYGFAYWSTLDGFPYDSEATDGTPKFGFYMAHANMNIEAEQAEFIFDPQILAGNLMYYYVDTATVSVDGNNIGLGEEVTLNAGTYDVTVKAEYDGKNYEGTNKAVVKAGETTIIRGFDLQYVPKTSNAWKFIFDPAEYDDEVNAGEISEVCLIGEMNGWSEENADYALIKQEDGTWVGSFSMNDISQGQMFKWFVDGSYVPDGMGNDLSVDSANDYIEEVNAWKFTFDPTVYDDEVNASEISEVYLIGEMNGWSENNTDYTLIKQGDGTWSNIFDAQEGQMFKWFVDKAYVPGGMGNDLVVGEAQDGVTDNLD